jgi:hypothetical protein
MLRPHKVASAPKKNALIGDVMGRAIIIEISVPGTGFEDSPRI